MIYNLIYFLIWPFGAFATGLKYNYQREYQLIYLLFFIYASYTLIPSDHYDISLYENRFGDYENVEFSFFVKELLKSLVGAGDLGFEFYIDGVNYLSNLLHGGLQLSYAISAIVFYIVWSSTLNLLKKEYYSSSHSNFVALLLLICFSLYIIIFRAINGRFYLAYWVFILGAYKTLNNNNLKYILISFISIYIHQSFLFGLIILFAFYLIRNNRSFKIEIALYSLVIIATLINELGISFIADNLKLISPAYEQKYSSYTDMGIIEIRGSRLRSWFLTLRTPVLFYTTFLAILLARINKQISFSVETWRFYYFFLFFWAINSFTFMVFQLGTRFRNVLIGFMILLLFKIYNENYKGKIPYEIIIFFAAFFIYKLISIRIMGEIISAYIFIPFGWLFNMVLENFPLWK